MKILRTCLALWTAGACAQAKPEKLRTAAVTFKPSSDILYPQRNYNGWVNPEDLPPMPQCIAQQDQFTWTSTMTKCTSSRCTSHFGIICTHHQWLTQLSCLSAGFSSDVIKVYLPYCSRSVLSKAQLHNWVREITGRTWLVDVGDANELEDLSPASLARGYATVDVVHKAPTCLTSSASAPEMEPFHQVMGSCSFTSTTQHTGNAARPWEYSGSRRSLIPLDFETAGYNLTGHRIAHGNYFDKECFCNSFALDPRNEPCSGQEQLDLTKERLWVNATCGPKYLPENWKEGLKTTQIAYVSLEDWRWPTCHKDMPEKVTERVDQCTTDACELNSSGYCKVKRAVDRACVCHNINYDSCGGSCQVFETRIDYVKWLHDLCSNVQDWQSLPDNWRQLAAPTPFDMIPWQWTLEPSNKSTLAPISYLDSSKAPHDCPSNGWKLGSLALINLAALPVAFLIRRTRDYRYIRDFYWHPPLWYWPSKGLLIACLQLLANWLNAFLIQNTLGYEDVPVLQLLLFWCSMPRMAWFLVVLIIAQPFERVDFSAAACVSMGEMVLQGLSSYYMIKTFNYGLAHDFYSGGLEEVIRGGPAKLMYVGALLWLFFMCVGIVQLILAIYRWTNATRTSDVHLPNRQKRQRTILNITGNLMRQFNEVYLWLEERLTHHWAKHDGAPGEASAMSSEGVYYTSYGTLPMKNQDVRDSQKEAEKLYTIVIMIMTLLWTAQWLFWGGFIGLSSELYCPSKLGILTAVWIIFSWASAAIGIFL